jgi:hypothetical protein
MDRGGRQQKVKIHRGERNKNAQRGRAAVGMSIALPTRLDYLQRR